MNNALKYGLPLILQTFQQSDTNLGITFTQTIYTTQAFISFE